MSQARVRVEIIRYTEDYPPGIVEYRLVDADGREWRREIKQVYVTSEELSSASQYPQPGQLDCEVVGRQEGAVRIVTDDGIECTVPESSMISPSAGAATGDA